MAQLHPAWVEHQDRRWLRPDASRWLRPDRDRYLRPELEVKNWETQPRVQVGNLGAGRWTTDGGSGGVRIAAGETPRLGPGAMAALAAHLAKRVIEAYRSENGLWDLFRQKDGTVTLTKINGSDVFGSNSTSPTYTAIDDDAARAMRDDLVHKFPDVLNADDIGKMPNNALFHAETTVLLRAARENGGSLAGLTLEVFADRPMCNNCDQILPYVGLELGNPTVTFIGPTGSRKTMRNGGWID